MIAEVNISADGELVVCKQEEDGLHYLIIGDCPHISYGFVSKIPGKYEVLHHSNGISLKEIVDKFNQEYQKLRT